MAQAFDAGDIDVVLLAIGVLPDQPRRSATRQLAVWTPSR